MCYVLPFFVYSCLEFLDLNSQLDNINTLLNQLEGKSDQLLSNLQALLQDIRQWAPLHLSSISFIPKHYHRLYKKIMDKERLQELIKSNAQLSKLLQCPKIQQFLHEILQDELTFEALKARFSSSSSSSSMPNNSRNNRHNFKQNKQKSAGFQNPNESPLSPLEIKLIEGNDSEEQQFLRLLFDLIQQS